MPRAPLWREVARTHVAGLGERSPDNFRGAFISLDVAAAYIASAGFTEEDQELWRIDRVVVGQRRPTRRRRWDDLRESYQKRLLGSRVMQAEARQAGMTVQEYYEVAPSLKAARGHGAGQHRGRYEVPNIKVWYEVYIARDYERVPAKTRRRWSRQAKAAWRLRKARTRPALENASPARLRDVLRDQFRTVGEALERDEEALRRLIEEEW